MSGAPVRRRGGVGPGCGGVERTTVGAMSIGTPIRSRLDTRSDEYQANLAQMQAMWDEVAALMDTVPTIGGQRYVDRHR